MQDQWKKNYPNPTYLVIILGSRFQVVHLCSNASLVVCISTNCTYAQSLYICVCFSSFFHGNGMRFRFKVISQLGDMLQARGYQGYPPPPPVGHRLGSPGFSRTWSGVHIHQRNSVNDYYWQSKAPASQLVNQSIWQRCSLF